MAMSTNRWTGHRGPPLCLWSQGVLRDRPLPRLHCGATISSSTAPLGSAPRQSPRKRAGLVPWGEGAITMPSVASSVTACRSASLHRGPARGAQPGHPRSGAQGWKQHPRAADRLYHWREHQLHARLRDRSQQGGLVAAGARHVRTIRPVVYGGWHLLGTARMGNDPGRSVVNAAGDAAMMLRTSSSSTAASSSLGRCESNLHHPGIGAVQDRRQHQATARNPVRLRPI